jgi:CO/xanthine dehydrogenase Mo-binding subunit
MAEDRKFRYIGQHRRAVEHRRFVTGQGHFAADVQLPGMLHVAIVASPYAHAKILSVNGVGALKS